MNEKKIGKILVGMFLVAVLCSALITPALADNKLTVPLYGQGWKDWGGDMIGTSSTSMAAAGCAITSIAMILGYYGMDKADSNPGKVNKVVTDCKGFWGASLNPDGWNKCIREMSEGKVQWKERVRGSKSNKINRLNQEIDNGYPVIIEIPYGAGSHFMVVTGRKGTTYYLNDPLEKYTTWNSWQPITSLRIYRGPIPTRTHSYGAIIRGVDDKIYQLINVRKRPIASDNVFHSWNFKAEQVITVSNKELAKYEEIEKIVFRDGTLIGDQTTGKKYIVENDEKRSISDDAFIQLGYKEENVIWLTDQSELDLCLDGEPIDLQEGTIWHPQGTLIKSSDNKIYEVLLGLGGYSKKLIPTANVFNARYGNWNMIVEVSDSQLNQYTTTSNPFGFPDGTLIMHGFDLYVIAGNEKRHIVDGEIKDILGYTWQPITISEEEFNLHELGEAITKKNSVKYSIVYVPDDYTTIQSAIDSAEAGDTIIVRDGTYVENININTDHLTIKSENGADSTIVQTANPNFSVFEITADYVNISGFTAIITTGDYMVGFYLHNGDCCNISYNIASANGNNMGIYVAYSNDNAVSGNIANENNHHGIYLYNSNNNIIFGNTASANENYIGIYLRLSNNNIISGNIANNNGCGISPHYSTNNIISGNIANNNGCGIYLPYSTNNIVYLNNFIDNANNAYFYDPTNTWNSPEQITYTYLGNTHTNYLGNYYSDYTDIDSNNDGIWDNPYGTYSNADNYPLTQPFENYLPKEPSTLEIKAFCPVNLSVEDPDGLTINIETNEIPEATYTETDINDDGDPDDIISISDRKIGDYVITVVPEPNASPADTYSLEVSADGETIILAEDVEINNIPIQPYLIQSTETEINALPVANANGPYTGFVGESITFDGTGSYDLDGAIVNYEWDLDDDGVFDDATGATPIITFDESYSGDIHLQVTDDDGATDIDSTTLTVSAIANQLPTANANGPYTGFVGDPITLNGTSSYDPDGAIVSYEWDLDDDGVFDDATGATPVITFGEPYSGDIHLQVTDDNGATDIDTTTLTVKIPATIDFDPDTLNLKSKGRWATIYIEFPEGYEVAGINVSTILVNYQAHAEMKPIEVGDYDSDGVTDLMVKFDRADVQELLEAGNEVEITVTGELSDETPFEGSDTIRVIDEGKDK